MANNPNSQFPANTNAPDANYPYGSARDIAVPGDGIGTPWQEDIVNDLWGLQQKLLNSAGIVPSGSPETILASQYHQAMRATAGFPGLIVPMALNVDPATAGIRVLALDGSGVLVASYSELAANVYVGNPANPTAEAFYRADDAAGTSRNVSGVYLILADFRGRFLRGIDPAGTLDTVAGRLPGNTQAQMQVFHYHKLLKKSSPFTRFVEEGATLSAGTDVVPKVFSSGDTGDQVFAQDITDASFGTSLDAGAELRPYNVALNYGIWY